MTQTDFKGIPRGLRAVQPWASETATPGRTILTTEFHRKILVGAAIAFSFLLGMAFSNAVLPTALDTQKEYFSGKLKKDKVEIQKLKRGTPNGSGDESSSVP